MIATATQRIIWTGPNNRTAHFGGHTLKVTERGGAFYGHFNGTKIERAYTSELGAKNALRRRALAGS